MKRKQALFQAREILARSDRNFASQHQYQAELDRVATELQADDPDHDRLSLNQKLLMGLVAVFIALMGYFILLAPHFLSDAVQ